MIHRTAWACVLIATLLVVSASASPTSSQREDAVTALQPGTVHGPSIGPPPPADPMPISGSGPGDDDLPNRGGIGPGPVQPTVGSTDGRMFWSTRGLAAWLKQHVVTIMRAWR